MGIHALWVGIWLIVGLAGYFVGVFAGLVWGHWYVENKKSAWGLVVTPLCWLLGTGWGLFALVQAILEFIKAVTALGPSL